MKKNIKIGIKVLGYPFLYVFRGLSCIVPRNKNIWIFGSAGGRAFNDNSKYLLLHIVSHHPEIRPIWITKSYTVLQYLNDKKIEAYSKYSIKGIFFSLVGKIHFFNHSLQDINYWTSARAIKVNLWHGIPIKKIEFDVTKGNKKFMEVFDNSLLSKFLYPSQYTRPSYVLSTSKKVSQIFSSAFRVECEQCIEFGYPRNDIFSYSEQEILSFIKKYDISNTEKLVNKIKRYNRTYIYMPTWRDDGSDFIRSSGIDFVRLNNVLKEKNELFILKLHNMTVIDVDLEKYENILLINNKIDVYTILPFTDCLITDYSSIYFDYKLMKKDIILFPFDKEKYVSKDREMYYQYDLLTDNEQVAYDFEVLLNYIKEYSTLFYNDNLFLEEMIFETSQMKASESIVEFFKNKLNII